MNKLLAILKVPGTAIAIVVSVISAYNYLEGLKQDNKAVKEEIIVIINERFDLVNTRIDNKFDSVNTRVSEISGGVDLLNRNFDTQTKAISNIFKKQSMYQDNIDFLQDLLNDQKKKSMTSMLPTALE